MRTRCWRLNCNSRRAGTTDRFEIILLVILSLRGEKTSNRYTRNRYTRLDASQRGCFARAGRENRLEGVLK